MDDGESKDKDMVVYKSRVIRKELDPEWNEGSKIFPVDFKHKEVRIALFNNNKMRGDDFMGQVTFKFIDINNGVPVDGWFELTGRKKKEKTSGEIHIQILFLEAEDKLLGEEFSHPIQCFIRKRHFDVVEQLVKRGGDLTHKDGEGFQPLHVACECNQPDVVQFLLETGAPVDAKAGKDEQTPLHVACAHSAESAVVLINHKADIRIADKKGNKPIHVAAINDQPKTIVCLLEAGASIDEQNTEDGNTPLHMTIQQKSFLALKKLVEKGADIYVTNKVGLTCGEAAASLDETTKEIFMTAVGVEDYLEIALLQEWKHRIRVEASGLDFEWQKSPQFAINASEPTEVMILVHHIDQLDNHNIGFCVIKGKYGEHKEPSLTELVGHGSNNKPFLAECDPDLKTIVVPYAKSKEQPDRISVLVFCKTKGIISVTTPAEWKCTQTVKGQWSGKMTGGCQSEENRKTWHKNPFFSLHIPDKEHVPVSIVLAQRKNAMEDIIPYQTYPYDFYIGFYLFDAEVETMIGQVPKWKNAREVICDFVLDGTKNRQYTLIPTTFKSKQETTFTITVHSDEPKVILKAFEA
eukprot:TRINITY_DN2282_c0_g2_i1.p1 TRINITY_DN2282_c0_g2~~TRINITY_DN2282_c0_g2_i1.p1  ORF type:complete len:579 (+),score=120.46 TRINITY_DN2282_c0_g2_i1:524-2260(+)